MCVMANETARGLLLYLRVETCEPHVTGFKNFVYDSKTKRADIIRKKQLRSQRVYRH